MIMVVREWNDRSDDKSRYRNTKRIELEDGFKQQETFERVSFKQDNSDKFFRVTAEYENRLDLVAWKFYGSPKYWWVLALASNIEDPLNVSAGTLLRVPDLDRVLSEV